MTYNEKVAIAYEITSAHDGEAFIYFPEYVTDEDADILTSAE